MEYESDWTKHRKSSAFTAQVIRSATSFMPWSCKMPIGLPDDVSKYILALVPRSNFPSMGAVSKKWRSYIRSKEFITVRKLLGLLEEWLCILTMDAEGKQSQWELLVMAGYSVIDGTGSASADVYEYDPCLNSWSKLANMNVARYEFACAEVNGMVYAVGGYGTDGESLSSAEVSSFTIGNSRFVDVYNPERHAWCQMKNGCVMVTAHAVIEKKLFCMEWKNQRKLAIFDPEDNSWKMVPVPLTGSSSIGFRFGILDGKLLLFSLEEEPGYNTLLYDPHAAPGSEWQTSRIKPSGLCLCSVTIIA
ncbi:hypothetical protein Patl1_16923 [Pistacia atlantica]|uniref:Uncharacterized protein n=1 Tax=Pistacia atlantica TaxID=434234 RepID=A0ACC1B8K4_9ROSI|nr:hypothetical protein Patl1_16923 [Pistacia atlantica]